MRIGTIKNLTATDPYEEFTKRFGISDYAATIFVMEHIDELCKVFGNLDLQITDAMVRDYLIASGSSTSVPRSAIAYAMANERGQIAQLYNDKLGFLIGKLAETVLARHVNPWNMADRNKLAPCCGIDEIVVKRLYDGMYSDNPLIALDMARILRDDNLREVSENCRNIVDRHAGADALFAQLDRVKDGAVLKELVHSIGKMALQDVKSRKFVLGVIELFSPGKLDHSCCTKLGNFLGVNGGDGWVDSYGVGSILLDRNKVSNWLYGRPRMLQEQNDDRFVLYSGCMSLELITIAKTYYQLHEGQSDTNLRERPIY